MKHFVALALTGLLGLASTSALACTAEDSIAKGEQLAQMIYDLTHDNPGKAEELNARLNALQERDPTDSHYSSCEAYQRLIDELNETPAATAATPELSN